MDALTPLPQYLDEETADMADWCRMHLDKDDAFAAARAITPRLGAIVNDGRTSFGFWTPDVPDDAAVWLEILRADEPISETLERQNVRFQRIRLPMLRAGAYCWAVVAHAQAGSRERTGDFYRLRYRPAQAEDNEIPEIVGDPLAASTPFGAFAPAEIYDLAAMFAARADAAYFNQPVNQSTSQPVNILQLHPGTASPEQTLSGLTRIFNEMGRKRAAGEPLTPAEQHFAGYDAVQLTPVEPSVEFEDGPGFWQMVEDHPDSNLVTVNLQRPNAVSWGYDALLCGAAAVNPALLATKRPDELLELIATLHTLPDGPVQVILNLNLGHLDEQAADLLPAAYFAGRTQYGLRPNVARPEVRALLLEILTRKLRYGPDGIRIDEAQEFLVKEAEGGELRLDKDFLALISELQADVADVHYAPWLAFEDGSPWPTADDELTATYQDGARRYRGVHRLGPLSLEGNAPFRQAYWPEHWWRLEEIAAHGRRWISGSANHDTLRRATHLPPDTPVNRWLGDSPPAVFAAGFDNPALWLLTYALLPGTPMTFLNGALRAPWTFIRNTDSRYSVQIVADEARFINWRVSDEAFAREDTLRRLKALGFASRDELLRFVTVLRYVVRATQGDLTNVVEMLNAVKPSLTGLGITEPSLRMLARAWMDDLFDYCNVWRYADQADPQQSDFALAIRNFRRERSWLSYNFGAQDRLDYLRPADGSVIVYGLRHAPDGGEQVLTVVNLEGPPRTLIPAELPLDLPRGGWEIGPASPGTQVADIEQSLGLSNGAGVVFVREG
ncbi:MAG: hypothetical protein H6642_06255 [Caldilineaceae bacterium]|nr:hypothetical protein [Caldilineaceae bacterium]